MSATSRDDNCDLAKCFYYWWCHSNQTFRQSLSVRGELCGMCRIFKFKMINFSRSKNFSYIKVCGFSVLHPKKNFSNLAKYTTGSYAASDMQLVLNIKSRAIMAASSTITLRISLKQTANKWIMFSPNLKVWKAWIYWSVTRAQDQPVWVSCVEQLPWYPNILKQPVISTVIQQKFIPGKFPGLFLRLDMPFPVCNAPAIMDNRGHINTPSLKGLEVISLEFLP